MILFAIIALLVATAFFDAVGTALLCVNRYRIRHLAEEGHLRARAVMRALNDPLMLPGSTLVGVTLCIIAASVFTTHWSRTHLPGLGHWAPLAAELALTPALLLFAEILPKMIGRRWSEPVSLALIQPFEVVHAMLYWFTRGATATAHGVLSLLGAGAGSPRFVFTRREIEALVSESEQAGSVESEDGRILSSVFVFGETRLSEVMVSRTEIAAVEKGESLRETLHAFRRHGYSSMPVFDESPDRIVGVVHLFDLFRATDWNLPVESLIHPVLFAPEAQKCDDLLKEMQLKHRHVAVVLDEYGGTAGMVSFEDLVEELVGEIEDEHEDEESGLRKESPGVYLADAQLKVDEVSEELGIALPEGEYETLAGLLLDRLGRIPRRGERVDFGVAELEVRSADRRKVNQVRLRVKPTPEAPE